MTKEGRIAAVSDVQTNTPPPFQREPLGWTIGRQCLEAGQNRFIRRVGNLIFEFADGLRVSRVYRTEEFRGLAISRVPPTLSNEHILAELKVVDCSQPSSLHDYARIFREKADINGQFDKLTLSFEWPAFANDRSRPKLDLRKLANKTIAIPNGDPSSPLVGLSSILPQPIWATTRHVDGEYIMVACDIFTDWFDISSNSLAGLESFRDSHGKTGKILGEPCQITNILSVQDLTPPMWRTRVRMPCPSTVGFIRTLESYLRPLGLEVFKAGRWTRGQITEAIMASLAFEGVEGRITNDTLDTLGHYRAYINCEHAVLAAKTLQVLKRDNGCISFTLSGPETDKWPQHIIGNASIWYTVWIQARDHLISDMAAWTAEKMQDWISGDEVDEVTALEQADGWVLQGTNRQKVVRAAVCAEEAIRGRELCYRNRVLDSVELYNKVGWTPLPGKTQHVFNDGPIRVCVDGITHKLYHAGPFPEGITTVGTDSPLDLVDPNHESTIAQRFSSQTTREPEAPPRRIWAPVTGRTQACPVCGCQPKNSKDLHVTSCGHMYCIDCFVPACGNGQVDSSTDLFEIRCMTCRAPIPNEEIEAAFGPDGFDGLLKTAYTTFLDRRQADFRYCPTVDCRGVHRTRPAPRHQDCPTCQFGMCEQCLALFCHECHGNHDPGRCPDVVDDDTRRLMEREGMKPCPRCGTVIQKDGGCNHMTCERCRAHLCWICLAVFVGPDGPNECADHLETMHAGLYDAGDEYYDIDDEDYIDDIRPGVEDATVMEAGVWPVEGQVEAEEDEDEDEGEGVEREWVERWW